VEQRANNDSEATVLLNDVEKFLKATRMPPTRFGRNAVGDPSFVFDLRDGRDPREATAARVRRYISASVQSSKA
jgi:hypothetical protein